MNAVSVAVVGAGLAGLACARRLAEAGVHARVFEAQRAPGGRLATRRFRAGELRPRRAIPDRDGRRVRAGFCRMRHAAGAARSLATGLARSRACRATSGSALPAMNALPRFLAEDLDVEYGARIMRLERGRRGWALLDDRGLAHTDFSAVALALPAPAAAALAGPHTR